MVFHHSTQSSSEDSLQTKLPVHQTNKGSCVKDLLMDPMKCIATRPSIRPIGRESHKALLAQWHPSLQLCEASEIGMLDRNVRAHGHTPCSNPQYVLP